MRGDRGGHQQGRGRPAEELQLPGDLESDESPEVVTKDVQRFGTFDQGVDELVGYLLQAGDRRFTVTVPSARILRGDDPKVIR